MKDLSLTRSGLSHPPPTLPPPPASAMCSGMKLKLAQYTDYSHMQCVIVSTQYTRTDVRMGWVIVSSTSTSSPPPPPNHPPPIVRLNLECGPSFHTEPLPTVR
jgi:hypothetical protein